MNTPLCKECFQHIEGQMIDKYIEERGEHNKNNNDKDKDEGEEEKKEEKVASRIYNKVRQLKFW